MIEVFDHDPQFKTLTICAGDKIPRIPLQIPLSIILRKYLKSTLLAIKEQLDLKYPPVKAIEDGIRAYKSIRRRDRVASEKFIDLLCRYFENTFYNPTISTVMPATDLYHFYKLVRVFIPHEDFGRDLVDMVRFPLNELLNHAARSTFADPINEDLLVEFQNHLPQTLILESFKAAKYNLVKVILALPTAYKMISIRDEQSRRPIHYAAHIGDMDLIARLINLGAEFKTVFDDRQEMAIDIAASSGHLNAVRFLYEMGAPINGKKYRPSPILNAVKNGHIHVVSFILNETNFFSHDDTYFNYELLETAVEANDVDIAKILRCSERLFYSEEQIDMLLKSVDWTLVNSNWMKRALCPDF